MQSANRRRKKTERAESKMEKKTTKPSTVTRGQSLAKDRVEEKVIKVGK